MNGCVGGWAPLVGSLRQEERSRMCGVGAHTGKEAAPQTFVGAVGRCLADTQMQGPMCAHRSISCPIRRHTGPAHPPTHSLQEAAKVEVEHKEAALVALQLELDRAQTAAVAAGAETQRAEQALAAVRGESADLWQLLEEAEHRLHGVGGGIT